MEYVDRVLDPYLADVVANLPAVTVEGCKGVGKTESANRLARTRIDLDQEAEIQALREDPDRIDRLGHPLLIDEWQLFPGVWDRVRRSVDRQPRPGSFILTGSATPLERPKHSGAARVVLVRMRPFSLVERGFTDSAVTLADLLTGERNDFHGDTSVRLDDYAREIVTGGLPALRSVPQRLRRTAWDGYLSEILDRKLEESGLDVRRPQTLRAWLRSYARATASTATYTDILDNATPNEPDKPAKSTTLSWREALGRMWLLDPLPAWEDPLHKLSRLGQAAKHHLADPALAAHLIGATASTLLTSPDPAGVLTPRPGTLFGALFESLVTLSVRVYAEPLGATVSHLRTKNGDREVDLIVTRPDGKCVAIEVKSAPDLIGSDVRNLQWLQSQLGDDLLDAIVVTTGPAAYRRDHDGIGVVPAALLGAGYPAAWME